MHVIGPINVDQGRVPGRRRVWCDSPSRFREDQLQRLAWKAHPLARQHRGDGDPEGVPDAPKPASRRCRVSSRASASPSAPPRRRSSPTACQAAGSVKARPPCSTAEKEAPVTRAHGVIALKEENCTACMLCVLSAPTGASTSRRTDPRPCGVGRQAAWSTSSTASTSTTVHVLRHLREVCPFERCSGVPVRVLRAHLGPDPRPVRLAQWMETVPDFEPYESGSEQKVKKVRDE